MVVLVRELGRITLPRVARETLGIDRDNKVKVYADEEQIIITRYEEKCVFCKSSKDINVVKNKMVCRKCLNELKRLK